MNTIDTEIGERLKRMVASDTRGEINDTLTVAQSDIMALLSEFMDVKKLDMRVDGGDCYRVTITAEADRIYGVGKLSERE